MDCLFCQKPLVKNSSVKFCNSSCSASFNNRGVRRHGNPKSNCLLCGSKTKSANGKYCSTLCSGKAKTKNNLKKLLDNELTPWKRIRNHLITTIGKCQNCSISDWNGNSLSFECDHIDGDGSNNRLSNARLLCPNCHSQTPTFRAKNIKNPLGKVHRSKRYMAHLSGLEPEIQD